MALIDAYKKVVAQRSGRSTLLRTPTRLGVRNVANQGQPPPQERPGKEGRSYGADLAAQMRAAKVAQTPRSFGQQLMNVMSNTFSPIGRNLAQQLGGIQFGGGLTQLPAGRLGQAQSFGTALHEQMHPPPAELTSNLGGKGGRWAAWDQQNLMPQEWKALQADFNSQINRWTDPNGNTYIRELDYENPGNFILSMIPADETAETTPGYYDGGYGGGGGGGGGDYINKWRAGLLEWSGL